jgi:hypothetical protein
VTPSREQIRLIPCPVCRAVSGEPCAWAGKGAAERRAAGTNHVHRLEAAQDIYNGRVSRHARPARRRPR